MTREIYTAEVLEDFKKRRMTLTQISCAIYGHPENYRNIRRAYKRHGIMPYTIEPLKPSKEELKRLIIEEGKSPVEVAQLLGYGPLGWSNIYAYCREYNITDFDFSPNAEIKKREIGQTEKSIILGTLLGDGSLTRYGALVVSHGEKQLEYIEWKKKMLGWLCDSDLYKRKSKGDGVYSKFPTYSLRTHSHPYFYKLREQLYAEKIKRVAPIIESEGFDDLALAVWYFDDGSLNKRYGTVTLATNSFLKEDVVLLVEFLRDKFEVDAILEPRRNNTLSIRVNTAKAARFFEVINRVSDILPKSMFYKLPSQ